MEEVSVCTSDEHRIFYRLSHETNCISDTRNPYGGQL